MQARECGFFIVLGVSLIFGLMYTAHLNGNLFVGLETRLAAAAASDGSDIAPPPAEYLTARKIPDKFVNERSMIAQEDSARWTKYLFMTAVFSAVVALFGVYVVRETLRETRAMVKKTAEATEVAERMGQMQVRAFLTCEDGKFGVDVAGGSMAVYVSNFGHSPALNCQLSGTLIVTEEEALGRRIERDFRRQVGMIPAGKVRHDIGVTFTGKELEDCGFLRVGTGNVAIKGEVSWNDVFKKLNRIRFCLLPDVRHNDLGRSSDFSLKACDVSYELMEI